MPPMGVAGVVVRFRAHEMSREGCTKRRFAYGTMCLAKNGLNSEGFWEKTLLPNAAKSNAAICAGVLGIWAPEASHSELVTCCEM